MRRHFSTRCRDSGAIDIDFARYAREFLDRASDIVDDLMSMTAPD
jgi:hypothetical protein